MNTPPEQQHRQEPRATLTSALEQLRLKLLDLTGRNRLLNFKHTPGRSLQSAEGDPQSLYVRLVEGNGRTAITIRGVPDPQRSDWLLRDGRLVRPDAADWAKIQGLPTSFDLPTNRGAEATFRALLYPDDLAKHCRKLEREANLAIEETGANMLFLALGFLEYPDQPQGARLFLAPLLSIPVTFSSQTQDNERVFEIDYTGDDVATNLSLHEKLRVDHGLVLPEFDEERAGVESYFADIQNAIQNRPGFAFKRRVSLCLLSFTNMLLVRDLDPETWPATGENHTFLDHVVIRQLFEGQPDTGGGALVDPPAHEIDEGPGAKIPLVFDADSSQHSALIEVLHENRQLVIEGPPGTGKSQTITNLIAASIATGRTVLFVAEKLAALEVVKSRLSSAGLDPFVLELHSSKTSKKRVLEELGRRIAFRPAAPIDLPRKLEQLTAYRLQLRAYVNLLKSVTNNAMGMKVHSLIWRTARYRLQLSVNEIIRSPPEVGSAAVLTPLTFNQRLDTLQHLAAQYLAIGGFNRDSAFWGFYPERLLPGDEHQLEQKFLAAAVWAARLVADAADYCAMLGANPVGLSLDMGAGQLHTINELRNRAPSDAPLHLLPRLFRADATGARVKQLFEKVKGRLARHRELEPAVRAGLLNEADGTIERRDALRQLGTLFETLGGNWGTANQLAEIASKLQGTAAALKQALSGTHKFCGSHDLPLIESRGDLARLEVCAAQAARLPEVHWRQFQPGLADQDATESLERLAKRQQEWQELHASLTERFYLDALPTEEALRAAMLVLREGPAWYRIFQRRWRAASAIHRSLLRAKHRVRAAERLDDVERVHAYLQRRERWRTDPTWARFCNLVPSGEPVKLDGYLAISRWYDEMRAAFNEQGRDSAAVGAMSIEQAKKFRREFLGLGVMLSSARANIATIDALLPRLQSGPAGQSALAAANGAEWASKTAGAQVPWLQSACPQSADFATCLAACEAADERRFIATELGSSAPIRDLLGEQYRGMATDVGSVLKALDWGQQVQSAELSPGVRRLMLGAQGLENSRRLSVCLERMIGGLSNARSLETDLQRYGRCDLSEWCQQRPDDDIAAFARNLQGRLVMAASQSQCLIEWAQYVVRRAEAQSQDLGDFVALLEKRGIPPNELTAAYGYATFSAIVRGIFSQSPELVRFSGLQQNQISSDFRRLDQEIIRARGHCIATDRARTSPPGGRGGARVDDKTEMALLNHLIPQQRPRVPVRKLLLRAQGAVQALKPCLMMGPQAVAQFLDPSGMKFDLVIMDEASQLRPEEAIGAIARGRQLVVVGDPKQLPPTTFFARQNQAGEEVDEYTTTEAESILDICLANFRPSRSLRWHYRSKHHSLIAFSNQHFYKGNLIVCPSPYGQNPRLGVRATYLAHATYENQTNLVEAQRVVDAVVEHITTRPTESLGVVTLNIKQRDLISELLEERLTSTPGAEDYKQRWLDERQGLFVKNLENVQGDERDCIMISTTFGQPPGASVVRQNFGPISRQGGWRRLNVLFTRARQSISIYTSLRPEDIVIDSSTPEGTKALRNYLEYARSGLLETPEQTEHEPDSDFEIAVIDVLRAMNYEVTPQLGVSGFRIDIAVKHPDHPGAYLAAIECDGSQYHSAQSARDRDRIRQEILESQGWRGRIWRIWSTDWYRGPSQEIAKLKSFLDHLRQTWKPEYSAGDSWTEEGAPTGELPEPPIEEQTQRQMVDRRLLLSEADREVQVGDTIDYVDTSRGEDILTVRITRSTTALEQGLIAELTPLAQVLLGGVVGDEVALNVPGVAKRILRIAAIKRDDK